MRLEMAREAAAAAGLDAIVATSYENVAYLSGTAILTQRLIPDRLAATILPTHGEPTIVVCSIETEQVRRESTLKDIREYVEFATSPVDLIADVITERGLGAGKIGIEAGILTMRHAEALRARIPAAQFTDVSDLLGSLRALKSPGESELLADAGMATDRAIRSAFCNIVPGTTERAIAREIAAGLLHSISGIAADSVAFVIVAAGPNARLAHPPPTDRSIEIGDVVRCDVGSHFGGYYSDIARTAVVVGATAEQESVYGRLAGAQAEVIAAARPGTRASELFALCRRALKQRQLDLNLPHIGHSIGLGLHERPMLSPYDDTPLKEGMMLAIEPAVIGPGGIFHIEDLILVTREGGRIVSRSADWDELLIVGSEAPAGV